jgi:uncharacterized integral membrane protein
MRFLRFAFLVILAVGLLVLALANREAVTLNVLSPELAEFAGWSPSVTVPLFVVIFGGIVAGVMIGFVWEWFREHKHRAEAATQRRERERLQREVDRLTPKSEKQDDVLALLENGTAAR